jgi:predicted nucleic acid-binding protein
MEKVKSFVDTNVLVYAHDYGEQSKRETAQALLAGLEECGCGVISTQVMLEFVSVARGKLKLPSASIVLILRHYAPWECVIHAPEMINDALLLADMEGISIWDAMLVAAAVRARCRVIYTEDLSDGQVIRGVRVVNPFK